MHHLSGDSPTIIAEFCQNHLGDFNLLSDMVAAAAEAGATHGKIQGLYSSELVFRERFEEKFSLDGGLTRPYRVELDRLEGLDLSESEEASFVELCIAEGITPSITVFSHSGVDRARNAGFRSIKIASYDCASIPMIERVLDFSNELFVSTGATSWSEVVATSEFLQSKKSSQLEWAFLHARTVYPTITNELRLGRMFALGGLAPRFGLSDHTSPDIEGLAATKLAIFLGASVVERHFTILPKSETRDGKVSVNPQELLEISGFSSLTFQDKSLEIEQILEKFPNALSASSLEPSGEEMVNRDYYRGRVASFFSGERAPSWQVWPG